MPEKYLRTKGQKIDVVKDYLEKQKKQQERAKERQEHQERQDDEAQVANEKSKRGPDEEADTRVRSSGDSQDTAVGTPPRVDSNNGDDRKGGDLSKRQTDKNHHPSKVVASWGRIEERIRTEESPEEIDEDDHTHPSHSLADKDDNIVTWYGPTDPANPQNWSLVKKCWATFLLCLLTFSIYIGSAIYSPGYESLIMEFGTNHTIATLGLTLFVIGYGIGPLFLAPLSEIPAIGRNPPYVLTLALFVIIQPITATVQNIPGLLVLRFLAGFIGSPVLATVGPTYVHSLACC